MISIFLFFLVDKYVQIRLFFMWMGIWKLQNISTGVQIATQDFPSYMFIVDKKYELPTLKRFNWCEAVRMSTPTR